MPDWSLELQQQYRSYRSRVESLGLRWYPEYPKSHWPGCDWGNNNPARRVELPADAPADFISCNACLIRERYIRILPCNPREPGWPHWWCQCSKCGYGLDCETWARVRGAGRQVEAALRQFDPDACHPVTWAETGLIPFHEGDLFFPDKAALDKFMATLAERYPAHFDESWQEPCYCVPADRAPSAVAEAGLETGRGSGIAGGKCRDPHCAGFLADFGFYPKSHDLHAS